MSPICDSTSGYDSLHESRAASRLLLIVATAAFVSDAVFDLFLSWTVASHQGVMKAAGMLASSVVWSALVSLGLGWVVDRFKHRNLMMIGIAGSIALLVLFLCLQPIIIGSWVLCVGWVLVNNVLNAMFFRSFTVASSLMFGPDGYVRFSARTAIIKRVISTGGIALGGMAIASMPGRWIAIVCVVPLIVALGLLPCLRLPSVTHPRDQADRPQVSARFAPQISYIMKDRQILSFMLMLMILNLAYGFTPTMLPIILGERSDSASFMGWLRAGLAVGEIIGLAVVERLTRHVRPLFRLSCLGCAVVVLCASANVAIAVAVLCLVLYGLFDALSQPVFGHMVTHIDPRRRGRVLGLIDAAVLLPSSVGMLVGTWLAQAHPWVAGVFVVIVFIAGWIVAEKGRVMQVEPYTADTDL